MQAARFMLTFAFALIFSLSSAIRSTSAAEEPPYRNPALPIQQRVDDLVGRMTLQEKISQMTHSADAIDRLGVPRYNWWNECLHGVARAGVATVYPQAIGLAAAWDTDLMFRISTAISDEARAKHHEFVRKDKRGIYQGLTFWSPNINLFRDPRWGRGMETYGEDPYLTGRMAVQFIRGLQGNDPKYLKVVATAKHYAVHSGPEPERHTFNAEVDERDFRESYLPHFEDAIREAGAYSVMCAYNRFRGDACCGSPTLLEKILRNEWGFNGYVVSDCWAIDDIFKTHKIVATAPEASALSVKAGTDLECGVAYKTLKTAVEKGLIAEKEIDVAVKRLFTARFRLGMFDPPERVPYARIPYSVVDSPAHRELAIEAALKTITLLKNENNILPLRKDVRTIAVIGPNANDVEVLLGNYNGIPTHPVTPADGIRQKVSAQTRVLYAQGCDWAENMPSFEPVPSSVLFTNDGGARKNGLKGEYFTNRELSGLPALTRIDPKVDFYWWERSPDPAIPDDDDFGVRWTGELVPQLSGEYYLGAVGLTGFRFYLDDKQLVRFEDEHHFSKTYEKVRLEAGKSYRIRLEYYEKSGDASIQMIWSVPGRDLEKEALDTARQADTVVLVMGLSPRLEGEEMKVPVEGFKGGDRMTLDLPATQDRLMKAIHALGKPVVLVLLNGSAVSVNWAAANFPAIVEAWYPGQAAGTAIADVLFGDANPGGRLPVTFYKSVDQLPQFNDYRMEGRTYRYFKGETLFPFGHGLSYTSFAYSRLKTSGRVRNGSSATVSVEVRNTGRIAGDEVVQLYLSRTQADVPVPIRSLAAFKRIHLRPGQSQKVEFTITPRLLSVIGTDMRPVIPAGRVEISVGGKQPGQKGLADAGTTAVLTGHFAIEPKP